MLNESVSWRIILGPQDVKSYQDRIGIEFDRDVTESCTRSKIRI